MKRSLATGCFQFLLLVRVTSLGTPTGCPVSSPCECEQSDDRLVLNCRRRNLDEIPPFQPSELLIDELTLAENKLVNVPNGSFTGLTVRRLDLTGNQLIQVSSGALSGLEESLEELLLELDHGANFPASALLLVPRLRLLKVIGYGRTTLPDGALSRSTGLESLSLTDGSLQTLRSTDVVGQRATLTTLDLTRNQFNAVPSAALAALKGLQVVQLNENSISVIGSRSFANASSLRRLDMSQNPVQKVESDAFLGLGSSLWNLSMQSCHLLDIHLEPLRTLRSLRDLNIAYNAITNVDRLIADMDSLETLDAMSNQIRALTGQTYRTASNSLRTLNLASNPLADVAEDTFSGLTVLEELNLDGAKLRLTANSFLSQRSTLRILSLRGTNLTESGWTALQGLSRLQAVWLSQCSIRSVPEFVFVDSGQLQTLDLSSNDIQNLTQRSLAGLHASLEAINLNTNKLTTLDHCVFYRFSKIDILKVGLANNPLQCDCGLHWLYEQLKAYRDDLRFSALMWRCANLNNKFFTSLDDSDFAHCVNMSTAGPCEDLIPSTSPTTVVSYPVDPSVGLLVNDNETTDTSLTITWSLATELRVTSLEVTYRRKGSTVAVKQDIPSLSDQEYRLTGLTPSTNYIVCLEVGTAAQGSFTSCTEATTAEANVKPASASMELILGVSIGCGLAVLLLVTILIVCCVCRHRQRHAKQPVTNAPKQSLQTKRFRKRGAVDRDSGGAMGNVSDADVDRAIAETVERLDPNSKDLLANLLRSASRASLDQLGPSSYYPPLQPSPYNHREPLATEISMTDRHVYEELPDDTYDQIPTDDTV